MRDFRYRENLDRIPQISAAFVRKHGFLDAPDPQGKFFVSYDMPFGIINIRSPAISILYTYEEYSIIQDVVIDYFWNGKVDNPYFVCPITRKTCRKLYFAGGLWASRQAHGFPQLRLTADDRRRRQMLVLRDKLLGTSTRRAATGRRRERVLDEVLKTLDSLGYLPAVWQPLAAVLEASFLEWERRARSTHRLGADTHRHIAVTDYSSALDIRAVRDYLADPSCASYWRSAAFEVGDRDLVKDYPCLNLNLLRRAGKVSPGYLHAIWLGREFEVGDNRVIAIVDCRDQARPKLIIVRVRIDGSAVTEQLLQLIPNARMSNRLFFQCPVTGKLKDKLYVRQGFAASAEAHQLSYSR